VLERRSHGRRRMAAAEDGRGSLVRREDPLSASDGRRASPQPDRSDVHGSPASWRS
jgi:hypothetical protein